MFVTTVEERYQQPGISDFFHGSCGQELCGRLRWCYPCPGRIDPSEQGRQSVWRGVPSSPRRPPGLAGHAQRVIALRTPPCDPLASKAVWTIELSARLAYTNEYILKGQKASVLKPMKLELRN